MKFVLTVILLIVGQEPQVAQIEMPSIEECHKAAQEWTSDLSPLKGEVGQLAAGCAVAKLEKEVEG